MTPKEKAKELVSKYNFEHLGDRYIIHQNIKESKRCALIAVDEILKEVVLTTIYWQEVKQEIELL